MPALKIEGAGIFFLCGLYFIHPKKSVKLVSLWKTKIRLKIRVTLKIRE